MSGIGKAAREVVHVFRSDVRSHICRNVIREKKQKLSKYGPEAERVLARAFVREAVHYFVEDDTKLGKREGRRYYTGAFAFATKSYIKGVMLGTCLAAARRAIQAGNHNAVWRLVALAQIYRPDELSVDKVDELFRRAGVDFCKLPAPSDNEPLGRSWSVRHLLPLAATA